MNNLVNSNFNRTYNPSRKQNALSDIKRFLTSRDTETQNKGCGYLREVVGRYNKNSIESARLVEYLLNSDITVFLCEATSNLDFSLFKSVLACLRLLLRERRFFAEEHAAHAMTAVLRALAHYTGSGFHAAVDACLQFLCDLFTGISVFETTSPLSHQSAYSAIQLLACLNDLAPRINTNPNTILASALVLHGLLSYQPDSLTIRGNTSRALTEIIKQWFVLLMGALNHSMLVGEGGKAETILVMVCLLGIDVLRLIKVLHHGNQKADFVQTILADEQEIADRRQNAIEMKNSVYRVMSELVVFIKENENQVPTEEYGMFLKFLLEFFHDNTNREVLPDFCDVLFTKGYLTMLPQAQIIRKDLMVRKVSTLVLGEMLKVLSEKYLQVESNQTSATDIHMGLVELQQGVELPQSIGLQLLKNRPYGLLIYLYFHCQSPENTDETTAFLLPHLVEHILRLPRSFLLPKYIIKALWLVFAMSTISNGSLESLEERVDLEKATDRLVTMLQPDLSLYYTHNPAILLWSFTSLRIPNYFRFQVLSQWLQLEDSIPEELTRENLIWELLLNILVQNKHAKTITNCEKVLHTCLEVADDESRQELAVMIWSSLPRVLSKALIDDSEIGKIQTGSKIIPYLLGSKIILMKMFSDDYSKAVCIQLESNICCLLDIATTLLPNDIDQATCLKIAVIITTIFSRNKDHNIEAELRHYYEYVCLKMCLYLLELSNNQDDNRVLITYIDRPDFLPSVLSTTNSANDKVACAALQLLSKVVHYFTKNQFVPKSLLQIQTNLVIKSLRQDSTNERGASLLQLVYLVLTSGRNTPLVLSYDFGEQPSVVQQCNALRALMLRIQLMLCCRESKSQSSAGWMTLTAIFKHAILAKNDTKLVATLTSQPWTHTLIQFQLTQNISEEFLSFLKTWLILLKTTINQSQEGKKNQMTKHSMVIRTMLILKKNLVINEEHAKVKEEIISIIWEILNESGVRLN